MLPYGYHRQHQRHHNHDHSYGRVYQDQDQHQENQNPPHDCRNGIKIEPNDDLDTRKEPSVAIQHSSYGMMMYLELRHLKTSKNRNKSSNKRSSNKTEGKEEEKRDTEYDCPRELFP